MKLEIERKFLLKSLPDQKADQVVQIEQFYFKNESGVWERARSWFSSNGQKKYIHTVKKTVSKGVNIEDEHDLTQKEFKSFKDMCYKTPDESKYIKKSRHIYKDGQLKWEIDEFNYSCNLIIAEIEIPTKDYEVIIPTFLKDLILLEVTGLKPFSNRSLASKIKKIQNG
jgi:CYTH domain-containing protein